MALDISKMKLAQDLKESLSVIESDGLGGDRVKIASIECVYYAGVDVNTEFGTTLILEDKSWTVVPLTPDDSIEEGDAFVLPNGDKLNVKRVNRVRGEKTGNVQWCICEQLA